MSLVNDSITVEVKQGDSVITISGTVIEKYSGVIKGVYEASFGNSNRFFKKDINTDFYMIQIASGEILHIPCSSLLKITSRND